ncbi:MAG TPA: acyl-CoA thioesterase II [Mycobacteriales bacterium]|nr:acyl-CoA thioesterase II [Mycobacteriales bacterium]
MSALLTILDLEQLEMNIFRGLSPDESVQRVFGGQVAGQALVAAGRTVPVERHVHSLHAYFLRPGDPSIPIVYEVDRIRDGRSFTTRRVVAVQHGKAIFHLSASFQIEEPGVEHQGMMPDAPAPETLMTMDQRREAAGIPSSERWERQVPIDLRYVDDPPWLASAALTPRNSQQVWIRANGEMPEDPLLHVCAVTYASDMTLLDSVLLANGLTWDDNRNVMVASLDHAMWFHRPFRADDWLLYDQQSPSASGARGLAIGRLFTRDGRHVVSVVQEGLLRVLSGSK